MTDILPRVAIDAASHSAVELEKRQLDAYNERDIEAFMECWAESAQIIASPSIPLATGAAEIRAHHVRRLEEPNLRAQLVQRSAVEGLVVDREMVTHNPERRHQSRCDCDLRIR